MDNTLDLSAQKMDNTPDLSALSASSSVMSTSTESSSTLVSFEMAEENEVTVKLINDIAYNYVALCIVGIGIFGNILNLIVLTRPKLKGEATLYFLMTLLSGIHN